MNDRPMKKIIATFLINYHKRRLQAALENMRRFGTETHMPVWCSERFRHHHAALRRLGFVVEREFTLNQKRISGREAYRAFSQLIQARFPDGYWSFTTGGKSVTVTAPASQFDEWQRVISEYDRAA
jgi:hypothetical protein